MPRSADGRCWVYRFQTSRQHCSTWDRWLELHTKHVDEGLIKLSVSVSTLCCCFESLNTARDSTDDLIVCCEDEITKKKVFERCLHSNNTSLQKLILIESIGSQNIFFFFCVPKCMTCVYMDTYATENISFLAIAPVREPNALCGRSHGCTCRERFNGGTAHMY